MTKEEKIEQVRKNCGLWQTSSNSNMTWVIREVEDGIFEAGWLEERLQTSPWKLMRRPAEEIFNAMDNPVRCGYIKIKDVEPPAPVVNINVEPNALIRWCEQR